jgi:hypothetical protein
MPSDLDNYDRKLFLEVPLLGPTQKKFAVTTGVFGNDGLNVELRDWVLGPDGIDGAMRWGPSSGIILTPEIWRKLMAVAPKITAYLNANA